MLRLAIETLLKKEPLTQQSAALAGKELLKGENHAQAAAFLMLLRSKGETVDELLGLLEAIQEQSTFLSFDHPVLDIVGTGGDGKGTVNLSTGAALLTAACGIPVVKHGNRAVSSQCGSADVLEALGFDIHLSQAALMQSVAKTNFGFCFAPDYHLALQKIRSLRKAVGFSTALHFLGPLLNPAGTDHILLGVFDETLVPLIAETLFRIGTKRSLVFHGHGLDELSCLGKIEALLVTETSIEPFSIDPQELGLALCTLKDLQGKDPLFNAALLRETLSGKRTGLTDTLILNTAAALFLYDHLPLQEGIKRARERLQQGHVIPRNYLQEILARKRRPEKVRKSLKAALAKDAILGEIKRASPRVGKIAEIPDPAAQAKHYEELGVSAISVLTDKDFEGSLQDLTLVAKAVDLPVLCKDFFLCPAQIAEAAQAGADAILLIVAALGEKTLPLVQTAHLFGLEVLVEVHDEKELEIALKSNADLIGVNQRNLRDFSMHPELFSKLIEKIPKEKIKIAESGIGSLEEAEKLFQLGYNAVLVGEALSRNTFFKVCHAH